MRHNNGRLWGKPTFGTGEVNPGTIIEKFRKQFKKWQYFGKTFCCLTINIAFQHKAKLLDHNGTSEFAEMPIKLQHQALFLI